LPFDQLKPLIDGMAANNDDELLKISYPVADNKMELQILEESKGGYGNKI